jgi:hypothetical protein
MLKPILIALFLVAVAASRLPVIDSDAVGVLAYEQDKPATPAAPARLEVPLERLVNRPLVRITVNGQGPFPFLIDAELTRTLIDPKKGAETPLALELGVGTTKIPMVPADVGDTASLIPELGPTARPSGVLSLDIWREQLVSINYQRWRMQIETGELRPFGRDIFALTPPSRELRVPLSVAGRSLECHIDPWFPGGLLLPAAYLTQLPLAGQPHDGGTVNTRAGAIPVREVSLTTDVVIGGFVFNAPLVQFGGSELVATLGSRWLTDFSITYDPANARVRLDRQRAH